MIYLFFHFIWVSGIQGVCLEKIRISECQSTVQTLLFSQLYPNTQYLILVHLWFFFFSLLCSNISEMRQSYKDAFLKKHNIKLGFMSAFVKAAAYALADQPAVNAGTHLTAVHFLSTLEYSFTAALWCVWGSCLLLNLKLMLCCF